MSQSPDTRSLADFALKGNHLAKMTGISVAVHAIPDAFLLMHTGVGCKYKTAAQIGNHDWGSPPNRREAWTQVAELQLIRGCSARIGPFARAWYERRRPKLMVVVSAYFIELTGEDFTDAVVAAEKTLPCDMALLTTAAPNKGFYDGYASVVLEVMKRGDWKAPPTAPKQATVVGSFFTRYEPDQTGDAAQLKTLVQAGGLDLGPVLLSGRPYAEMLQAPSSRVVIQLPYMRPVARKVRRLLKQREVIEADLPIGIEATCRFVRQVAHASGADLDRVETRLAAQVDATRQQIRKVSDHFRNLDVAVFADAPLAAGLVSLMHDMGVRCPVVGLRDKDGSLGGRTAFFEALERNGITDWDDMQVVVDPPLSWTLDTCSRLIDEGRLSGVIGSSHELNLFLHQPRSRMLTTHMFLLEAGFPSDAQHATFAQPTFGFAGAVRWAQRILDGVRQPRLAGESRWG